MPEVEITAEQFSAAVDRSRLDVAEVARRLGVTRQTVYSYLERGVTRASSVAKVEEQLALWLTDKTGHPLVGYTDADLVREIGRRLGVTTNLSGDPDTNDGSKGGHRIRGTGGPPA